jgi:hypothetical protein
MLRTVPSTPCKAECADSLLHCWLDCLHVQQPSLNGSTAQQKLQSRLCWPAWGHPAVLSAQIDEAFNMWAMMSALADAVVNTAV